MVRERFHARWQWPGDRERVSSREERSLSRDLQARGVPSSTPSRVRASSRLSAR